MEDAAPPPRRADRLSWAVFLVLAVIYRWGRCPSFGGGDSPAVVYHALFGPVRNFFTAVTWLAARLPFDTHEGNVNALSGLFHAGAAALLFATLRRLGIKRVPALTAVAFLAFSRRYWYYALVAGCGPAIVFAIALTIWGVIAWKDEAKAWPLAYSLVGALFLLFYPTYVYTDPPILLFLFLCVINLYFPAGLVIPGLWIAAFLGALLLQRLETKSRAAARILLAISLIVPIARPYSLTSHNPTLEWAQAATKSAGEYDRFDMVDLGLKYAIAYSMAKKFSKYDPGFRVLHWYSNGFASDIEWRDIRWDLWNPKESDYSPNGLLLSRKSLRDPKTHVETSVESLDEMEVARRAADVLGMPTLSSMGRRDRAKYGFAPEAVLFEEYSLILKRYRDLLPNHPELRARLDAQLAEYETGPAAKP